MTTIPSKALLACIAAAALSLLPERFASAQAPTATSASTDAQAVELFRDGRRLLVAQQYVEACARFRQSLALKRSPGILLNVGDCLVRESDPVRALETYEEALALAERAPDSPSRTAWLLDARREIDVLRRQLAAAAPSVTATPRPVASPPNVEVPSPVPAPAASAPAQAAQDAAGAPEAVPVAAPSAGSVPAETPSPAGADASENGGAYTLLGIGGVAAAAALVVGVAASQTAPNCGDGRFAACTPDQQEKQDRSAILAYTAIGCLGTAALFGILGALQLHDAGKQAAAAAPRSSLSVLFGSRAQAPVLLELSGTF